jgi:hypothetical protein
MKKPSPIRHTAIYKSPYSLDLLGVGRVAHSARVPPFLTNRSLCLGLLQSSQRKRSTKASPLRPPKFVNFAKLFKSPKLSEIVATRKGDPFCKESRSWVSRLWNSLLWRLWCVPVTGAPTKIRNSAKSVNESEHLDNEETLECLPCARVFAARKAYFNHP